MSSLTQQPEATVGLRLPKGAASLLRAPSCLAYPQGRARHPTHGWHMFPRLLCCCPAVLRLRRASSLRTLRCPGRTLWLLAAMSRKTGLRMDSAWASPASQRSVATEQCSHAKPVARQVVAVAAWEEVHSRCQSCPWEECLPAAEQQRHQQGFPLLIG